MAETEVVPIDMPDSNGEMTWQASILLLYEDYLLECLLAKVYLSRALLANWMSVLIIFFLSFGLYRTQPTMSYWLMGMALVSHM